MDLSLVIKSDKNSKFLTSTSKISNIAYLIYEVSVKLYCKRLKQ